MDRKKLFWSLISYDPANGFSKGIWAKGIPYWPGEMIEVRQHDDPPGLWHQARLVRFDQRDGAVCTGERDTIETAWPEYRKIDRPSDWMD